MTLRLIAFTLASLALIAIPGPNMVYIITRTASQGLRAGLASAFGVEVGTLVHIAAAGVGVAALIAASPWAFAALKYAGVVYLVFLGAQALRRPAMAFDATVSSAPLWRLFVDGAVVNVLNPKVALFFLAFLPQFVHTSREMVVFASVFFALGLAADIGYSLAAHAVGPWLRRARIGRGWLAGIYFGLGALAALQG